MGLVLVLFLFGCDKPIDQVGDEIKEPVTEEQDISSLETEDEEEQEEKVEEIIEPDEVLVYEETISLEPEFVGDLYGDNYEFYIDFKELGINEDYPYIKFNLVSEDDFGVHFMQKSFERYRKEYKEFYGFGDIFDNKGYEKYYESYMNWLEGYRMAGCDDYNSEAEIASSYGSMSGKLLKESKNEVKRYGAGELYILNGSCLVYNPDWEGGIYIINDFDYIKDVNGEIEINVQLFKTKGKLPKVFENATEFEIMCPPKTEECKVPWIYQGIQKEGIRKGLHSYRCDEAFEPDGYILWNYCQEIYELCNNFEDDDEDDLMDCDDPDCSEDSYCEDD